MKQVVGLIAAVAALTAVAVAQTPTPPDAPSAAPAAAPVVIPPSACPEFPAPPTLPALDSLKRKSEVDAGTTAFNAWQAETQTVSTCRRDEAQRAIEAVRLANAVSEARVREFNAGQQRLAATQSQWKQVVEGWNARDRGEGRRDR